MDRTLRLQVQDPGAIDEPQGPGFQARAESERSIFENRDFSELDVPHEGEGRTFTPRAPTLVSSRTKTLIRVHWEGAIDTAWLLPSLASYFLPSATPFLIIPRHRAFPSFPNVLPLSFLSRHSVFFLPQPVPHRALT